MMRVQYIYSLLADREREKERERGDYPARIYGI
jgi:hypothetical protein